MFHIPEDVLLLVLSNLPVKTLLRFRCVSKQWKSIIDGNRFTILHLNQSIQSRNNRILVFSLPKLSSLTLDSIQDQNPKINPTVNQFVHPFDQLDDFDQFQCIGSCNGLLCLMKTKDYSTVICNPSTRKYLEPVIDPLSWPDFYMDVFGFGYDACTDDYKLVRLSSQIHGPSRPYVLEIYSVKKGSWTRVHDCLRNVGVIYAIFANSKFVLGSLHWFVEQQRVACIALDLKDENFYSISLPKHHDDTSFDNFGEFNECLCVSSNDHANQKFTIWVMKHYANEESWTKLVSIGVEVGKYIPTMKLVAFSKSGREILLCVENSALLWYDLENKSFGKECNFVDCASRFHVCDDTLVQLHVNDFMSCGNDLGFHGIYYSENNKYAKSQDEKEEYQRRLLKLIRSMRNL